MRKIIIVILLISIQEAFGQGDYNPFIYFQIEQAFRAYPFLNPASIAGNKNITLNAGSQFNGGPFQNTRKYYFQSSMPIGFMKGGFRQGHFGLVFQGDKEGLLLSRTRWNLQYAWSTQINQTWSLAFGASMGQLGYFVNATAVSQGGSSNIVDGHVGGWLFSKNTYFGLSANQIFEGELAPIQQAFKISRVYHFIGGRKFDVTPNLQLQPTITILYDPTYDDQYDLTLLGRFYKSFNTGAVIRFGRSLVMVAGLEHLRLGFFSDFSATFSYSYPLGTYAPDIRIYGIDLIFEIDLVTFPKTSG